MNICRNSQLAAELPKRIASLPVGHLQIEGRAAALLNGYKTIGHVVEASADRTAFTPESTRPRQIVRVLNLLIAAIRRDGEGGWDAFRKTRPPFVSASTIYFYSPKLERLQGAVRDFSMAKVHMSRRAINGLSKAGMPTIGAVINGTRKGVVGLRAIGQLTTIELTEMLDALADSVTRENSIDWIGYATRRRFNVLPEERQNAYSGRDFLWAFPRICTDMVTSKFGAQGSFVLEKRLLRHPDIPVFLAEIGRHLNLTAERARLIEHAILKMLKRVIWSDEYRGCRFRVRSEFLEPLRLLAARVQEIPTGCLTVSRWRALLRDNWQVEPADLGQQSTLLLQLLNIESELPQELPEGATTAGVKAGVEIMRFFALQEALAFSSYDVWHHLRQRLGAGAPDEAATVALLDSLPKLEHVPTRDRYRVRLADIRKNVDRYERVLRDRGTPMHYSEIYAEIINARPDALRGRGDRTVATQMAGAKRFVPVGRTGVWSLGEWSHVETGTIAGVAARILRELKTPLTEDALYERIRTVRQLSRKSISTVLRENGGFRRVGPMTWALRANADRTSPET